MILVEIYLSILFKDVIKFIKTLAWEPSFDWNNKSPLNTPIQIINRQFGDNERRSLTID